MLLGQKRVDEYGIALTIDKRDSVGHPRESFLAGRHACRGALTLLGQQLPFKS
jgi:hypothetical protein